jgi:hypothetical protein
LDIDVRVADDPWLRYQWLKKQLLTKSHTKKRCYRQLKTSEDFLIRETEKGSGFVIFHKKIAGGGCTN